MCVCLVVLFDSGDLFPDDQDVPRVFDQPEFANGRHRNPRNVRQIINGHPFYGLGHVKQIRFKNQRHLGSITLHGIGEQEGQVYVADARDYSVVLPPREWTFRR